MIGREVWIIAPLLFGIEAYLIWQARKMKGREIWIIAPLFCGVVAYLIWQVRNDPWTPMRIAGVCLILFGFFFWTLARIQLGAAFSVAAKASILVTHGLYSRIRNPIYVFGSVMVAGFCLFYEKPKYLLVFLILIPMQILRARKEAKVLEAKFGEAYREYRSRTWF